MSILLGLWKLLLRSSLGRELLLEPCPFNWSDTLMVHSPRRVMSIMSHELGMKLGSLQVGHRPKATGSIFDGHMIKSLEISKSLAPAYGLLPVACTDGAWGFFGSLF